MLQFGTVLNRLKVNLEGLKYRKSYFEDAHSLLKDQLTQKSIFLDFAHISINCDKLAKKQNAEKSKALSRAQVKL